MGNTFSLDPSRGRGGREVLDVSKASATSFHPMAEMRGRLSINEHRNLSTWKLCTKYKTAIVWSLFISLSSLMWGYDVLLSHGLTSIPAFQQDFGTINDGIYTIPSHWRILFHITPYLGGLVGGLAAGYYVDTYGTKNSLAFSCIISTGSISLQIFGEDRGTFFGGKLAHGLSLGAFLTISTVYAAEIVPPSLRFFTTSSVLFLISAGELLANIILKVFGSGTFPTAYKIPLTFQVILPVLLLCGLTFCPESPWFLLRNGETQKCHDTLGRLGFPNPHATMEEMTFTVEAELGRKGKKGYLDCFQKEDLRRTEIAVGTFIASQLTGVVFIVNYSTYFFKLAFHGAKVSHSSNLIYASATAFSLFIGVSVLGLIGLVSSWFLINNTNLGGRDLMLHGSMALIALLASIGILDVIPTDSKVPIYIQCVCITLYAVVYYLTMGSASIAIWAAVGSTTLRSRTCALVIVVQSLFCILMSIILPVMIRPDRANLGGKIGFIFAGTEFLCLIWIYFRLPETLNRDAAEMDILFREKVPTKKFKSYEFDVAEA